MEFVRYIKLTLTFFFHLDQWLQWLELLVIKPKFLAPKLSSITFYEFNAKGFFAFVEEIVHQDSKLFMGSLDTYSLFISLLLKRQSIFVPICYITP